MAATYEPIATATVNTNVINFTGIPQTYTDLRVVVIGRSGNSATQLQLRLNNNSSSLYSWTFMRGFRGGSVQSAGSNNMTEIYVTDTGVGFDTTIPSTGFIDIFDYTSANNKPIQQLTYADFNGSGCVQQGVNLFRSSAAITSLYFFQSAGNFNGTITVYGIKAA